ncbi:MAG: hypothetical protein ACPLQS_01210 [Desulfurococcaceae archaeon]
MNKGLCIKCLMYSSLFNALLSVLSLVLMITGLLRYNPLLTGKVTYDYFVWASTILSLISVYGELRRLRDKPRGHRTSWLHSITSANVSRVEEEEQAQRVHRVNGGCG